MPVIAGALLVMLVTSHATSIGMGPSVDTNMLWAFGMSAVFAYGTMRLFMHWVERVGLMPFVIYRLLLGLVLWVWVTQGT